MEKIKKWINRFFKREFCIYLFVIVLVCIWFPFIGRKENLDALQNATVSSVIVLSIPFIVSYIGIIEKKCYIPRFLNFLLLVIWVILIAFILHCKSWFGELAFVVAVDLALMIIVNCYFAYLLNRENKKIIETDDFLLRDTPTLEDDYNRKSIVKGIVKAIQVDVGNSISTEDGSFVFNINESYGTGKSSCMLLLKDELKKEGILYFDFLPWKAKSVSNMIESFFVELQNILVPHIYVQEKWYIKQYAKMIFKNVDFCSKMEFLSFDKGLNEKYQQIRKILTLKLKRPIVVIVDDVDRLMQDELWGLLNLVRNVANFPYLYFVMNADVKYIEATLSSEKTTPEAIDEYIKKIINLQVLFPVTNESLILREFDKLLENAYQKVQHKNANEKRIKAAELFDTSKDCFLLLGNFRELKRFYNSLVFSIETNLNSSTYENFLFRDYVKLELIKYFAPSIYQLLRDNPFDILTTQSKRYVLNKKCKKIVSRKIEMEFDNIADLKNNEKSLDNELSNATDEIVDQITSKHDVVTSFVNDLLSALFFDECNYQKEESIRFIDSYDIYFSNQTIPNHISMSSFLNIFYHQEESYLNKVTVTNIESFYHNIRILLQNKGEIPNTIVFIEQVCFWVEYGAKIPRTNDIWPVSELTKVENEFSQEISYLWDFFAKDNVEARSNVTALISFLGKDGLLYGKICLVRYLFTSLDRLILTKEDKTEIVNLLSKKSLSKLTNLWTADKNCCYDLIKYMWSIDRYSKWKDKFIDFLKGHNCAEWLLDCISYDEENKSYQVNNTNFDRLFPIKSTLNSLRNKCPKLVSLLLDKETLETATIDKYPFLNKISTGR